MLWGNIWKILPKKCMTRRILNLNYNSRLLNTHKMIILWKNVVWQNDWRPDGQEERHIFSNHMNKHKQSVCVWRRRMWTHLEWKPQWHLIDVLVLFVTIPSNNCRCDLSFGDECVLQLRYNCICSQFQYLYFHFTLAFVSEICFRKISAWTSGNRAWMLQVLRIIRWNHHRHRFTAAHVWSWTNFVVFRLFESYTC